MQNERYPFNILFVEDEKEIRDNYVLYFKILFNEVYEAANAEQAYEIYKQKKPHIMIVDIHLANMSGIELLNKIRKTDQITKAIMLTAYTDTALLLDANSLKLTKYLVKPITRIQLRDALDIAVEELNSFKVTQLQKINLKDNYSWDYKLEELRSNNIIITLTKKETAILVLLISTLNKIFTYDDIIYKVWVDENTATNETLKTTIKTLRRKLPTGLIKNIFGTGYKIER